MRTLLSAIRTRLLPAILTAAGVVLVAAGLLSYADPTQAGVIPEQSAVIETMDPSDLPSVAPTSPPGSPGAPGASASPGSSATAKPAKDGYATRVVVPALKIDLPVIAGNDGYPYCDVAMYIDNLGPPLKDLGRPGRAGATYLFAHARDGMFGPIYHLAIEKGQPRKMLGMIVQVYTSDDKLYLYEVTSVLVHQLNLDDAIGASTSELWLQTSEGPHGTPGKTQLRAFLLSVGDADPKDAHPKPKPVACG